MQVSEAALKKFEAMQINHLGGCRYHMPENLRAITRALLECNMTGKMAQTYRTAKAMELLCETLRVGADETLVPCLDHGGLSATDTARIMQARVVIDEHWSQKLTLDHIARMCGLNRSKLTCGFRQLFHCTVAEALAEKRLLEARRMLLTTDMSVSAIGYKAGYQNNASFSRAFGRRFGAPPSDYKAGKVAA